MFRDSETGLVYHHGTMWRSPVVPRRIQLVGFLFGTVYLLLVTRFVLAYVGARPVPFVELVNRASDPFYAPFRGIIACGTDVAGHLIAWPIVVAIVAYVALHGLVVAILRAARVHADD